ncbi:MAG: hypothetical protein K6G42_10045 [Lachnospiraceae bacterium]|nr:hypothetical protein [Lachnospiraceae bacterium]
MAKGNNKKWYKLDNAAKIIPSSAHGADTRVFRICCELKEDVRPEVLQQAHDDVIEDFPLFRCVLKRGFFWYYLEDSDFKLKIEEDHLHACSPIYYPGRVNLLYRVNYYGRRINLEMFHVLADGTGGFIFLKRLVSRYLELAHDLKDVRYEGETSSVSEKGDDAFDQYYSRQKLGRQLKQLKNISVGRAHQITGDIDENLLPHLIEGTVSAKKIIALAKENETTVGVYTTSLYVQAIIDSMSMSERQRPIVISVPVNLRQFFNSDTTRNFFGVITIVYRPTEYDGNIATIIKKVKEEYDLQLKEESVERIMNTYASFEHHIAIKMVPIWIKDLVISFFNKESKKGITSTLSNLGRIQMPETLTPYIDRFAAFMAAPSQQICITSFGDRMVFGEVSPYSTHDAMMYFFRRLISLGVDVELASNDHNAKGGESGTDPVNEAGNKKKKRGRGKHGKK